MTVGRNVTTNSRMKTVNRTCDVDEQEETVYTCPANCRSHISMLFIKNAGGTVTVDVEFNRSAATQTSLGTDAHAHILGSKNMSTGEYIQFSGAEMVMEPGDTITAVADGTTPHVDIIVTAEEFFLVPG